MAITLTKFMQQARRKQSTLTKPKRRKRPSQIVRKSSHISPRRPRQSRAQNWYTTAKRVYRMMS